MICRWVGKGGGGANKSQWCLLYYSDTHQPNQPVCTCCNQPLLYVRFKLFKCKTLCINYCWNFVLRFMFSEVRSGNLLKLLNYNGYHIKRNVAQPTRQLCNLLRFVSKTKLWDVSDPFFDLNTSRNKAVAARYTFGQCQDEVIFYILLSSDEGNYRI